MADALLDALAPPPVAQNPAPIAAQPQAPEQMVNVVDPDTQALGSIPASKLHEALNQGFTVATPEHVDKHFKEQEYGSAGQQAIAGVEGLAKGLLGPIATGAERLAGVSPIGIEARQEVNPITHGIGEATGLIAPAVLTGGESLAAKATLGGAMEAAGSAGIKALGIEAAATPLAKIGSAAVKGAIENMVFQGSDEVSRMILQDPNQSAQTAVADLGLAALIGGGLGGAFGAVNPLWHAAVGSKVGGLLNAVVKKAGGIEGAITGDMEHVIAKSGMELDPIAKAALSDDPIVQNAVSRLNQTDITSSGRQVQEVLAQTRADISDNIVRSLGKEPKALETAEFSPYQTGKAIGDTLASEIRETMDPLTKEFEALKSKYEKAELPTDQIDTLGTSAIPGTTTQIAEKIQKLAEEQGWMSSPSSDVMKEVNRTIKELPQQKTLKDLGNYMTQIGNNTASTLPFGAQTPLSRAGQLIKGILRDAEADVAMAKLGNEAPELLERYKTARDAYKIQSQLKEALNDRLKVGGSTSGFAKSVRNMAQTDGESLLRRLSGKGDADLLSLLEANYPKTAQLVKDYHVNEILGKASKAAKPGEIINSGTLIKQLDAMPPELRNFAIPAQALDKVNAMSKMLDSLNSIKHNFSNTARTLENKLIDLPGSAGAIAGAIIGHNPVAGYLIGKAAHYLGKDVPDAVRLAMLKFLGSDKPINAAGFKSMVDMIQATSKGEAAINKATKNIFKADAAIISEHMRPSEGDRTKLDKALKKAQTNPEDLLKVGDSHHYMPEYGTAVGQVAANATNYLNSKRPNTSKAAPLDSEPKPSSTAMAEFNRTLNLAQQPLMILEHIKQGNITPQDIVTVRTLYPDLYNRISQKLVDGISNNVSKGDTVPYNTRLGLSMFLGMPLDSTMSPSAIMNAQPVPKEAPQQGNPNVKKTGSSLTKMPKAYQTPEQAREARELK